MEATHILIARTAPAFGAGSLALSARPDAPVLPVEPTRARRRALGSAGAVAAWRRTGRVRPRSGRRLAVGG